jgi:hypothetical protein
MTRSPEAFLMSNPDGLDPPPGGSMTPVPHLLGFMMALSLTAVHVSSTVAAEVSTDVAKVREVTSGNIRVVLLRVGQVIDFTGDSKTPPMKFLEASVMVEVLAGDKGEPAANGFEAFAAGTTKPAMRFLTDTKWAAGVETYADYEKKKLTRLPAVKRKNRAFVMWLVIPNSELTARRLDLKIRIEMPKNEDHVLWFKGINLTGE